MRRYFHVTYAFQQLEDLPEGYAVPAGREKPWGTGHAILSCIGSVRGPFAVINADDFYGPAAFSAIYDFLASNEDRSRYAMVSYRLRDTVTERTKIFKRGNDAAYTENGETFVNLPGDTMVFMNLWGFTNQMMQELEARFPAFLDQSLAENPMKGQYFLPTVVNDQLVAGTAEAIVSEI